MISWKEITRFEGPESSPGFLLWKLSTQWRREIEFALAPLGLTHPQFVLLACLGWMTRGGSYVSQAELARFCSADINMTSQVLRALEKRKMIERHKQEGNERSKYPCLTKLGSLHVKLAIPVVESVDEKFFSTHQNLLQRLAKENTCVTG